MSEPTAQSQQKYPRRFWINVSLFTLVSTAAWLWFNVHLKPHGDERWFGGISILAAAAYAAGLIKIFVGEDARNTLRTGMRARRTTHALLILMVFVAFAHLTTVSVYLRADTNMQPRYVFVVHRDGQQPQRVEISKTRPEHPITKYLAFGRMDIRIATEDPPGYRDKNVAVWAGATDVNLPDPKTRKSPHLLRLVPGRNLFRLRDRRPNGDFSLAVLRDGQELFSRHALKFETIYLGSALHAVDAEHARPEYQRELESYARMLETPEGDIPGLVARWLNHKTKEAPKEDFHEKDKITIVVRFKGEPTFEETVEITRGRNINTIFLTGALQ